MSASKYRCSFQLSLKNSARFVLMQNVLFSSNNNRRRWDVYVACRLARPALLLERNQLNKALNTKRKLTQSLYVFVVIFSPLPHSKGVGGGEEEEMMQDTPKKHPTHAKLPHAAKHSLQSAQPKWLEFKSAARSLVL